MRIIKRVNSIDILNYILEFFPNFKIGKNPFEFTYAYYLDNNIVGFIDYSIIYDKAEINYIAVSLNYRRMGIAQELFDSFVSKLKNIDNISLEVDVNNKEAINFYLKNIFFNEAIRKNYYNGEDAYLMVKKMEVK